MSDQDLSKKKYCSASSGDVRRCSGDVRHCFGDDVTFDVVLVTLGVFLAA